MRLTTVALLLLAACARAPSPQLPASDPTDEAAVQSTVLNEFAREARSLVVLGNTVRGANHYVDEDYRGALQELGALAAGLREDFDRKRAETVPVRQLSARIPVTLVSRPALDSIGGANPREYWDAFRSRFPGAFGLIALSRVGFSSDGSHAMVLADYGCGGRCGGTRYYLLERAAGSWRIVRMAQPRIS